jgi:hypothetical protein
MLRQHVSRLAFSFQQIGHASAERTSEPLVERPARPSRMRSKGKQERKLQALAGSDRFGRTERAVVASVLEDTVLESHPLYEAARRHGSVDLALVPPAR